MRHAVNIEHGAELPFPDLLQLIVIPGNGARLGPGAGKLIQLTYLFFQGHQPKKGIDFPGDR